MTVTIEGFNPKRLVKYSETSTDAAWFHLVREARDVGVIARFTVDGEPVSKARARFTRSGRSFTPQKTVDAEANVAEAFRECVGEGYEPSSDLTYGVTALFFHGTRQRRDIDNCIKLVLDGLNKVAWADDAQVVEVSSRKVLEQPEHARTEVVVYAVGAVQHHMRTCATCGTSFKIAPGSTRKYCSTKCRGDGIRKPRPACRVCGQPVTEMDATYCSRACMSEGRRKPPARCAQCGKTLTKQGVRLCRGCFTSPDLSTDCRKLRHEVCESCACVCHMDEEAA